jgi:hypothetical protein
MRNFAILPPVTQESRMGFAIILNIFLARKLEFETHEGILQLRLHLPFLAPQDCCLPKLSLHRLAQ